MLADPDTTVEIRHAYPALTDGFYKPEETHRWTDGMARLPEALLRLFARPLILEVHLAPSALAYRCAPPATSRAVA